MEVINIEEDYQFYLLLWDYQKSNFVDENEIKQTKEIIKKCEDQTDILRYLARKYKITEFVITMYREMGQRQGQIKFDKEK